MGMSQRLSDPRWVISREDPSLSYFDNKSLMEYARTLDIEVLGDLSKATKPPVLWQIAPLECRFDYLDEGPKTNWWQVLQLHLRDVKNIGFDLNWEKEQSEPHKYMADDDRAKVNLNFAKDLGSMVIELAKGDGHIIPFSMPGGFLPAMARYRLLRASQEASAHMGAAVANKN